jgi:hypothetical protein
MKPTIVAIAFATALISTSALAAIPFECERISPADAAVLSMEQLDARLSAAIRAATRVTENATKTLGTGSLPGVTKSAEIEMTACNNAVRNLLALMREKKANKQ